MSRIREISPWLPVLPEWRAWDATTESEDDVADSPAYDAQSAACEWGDTVDGRADLERFAGGCETHVRAATGGEVSVWLVKCADGDVTAREVR